MQLLEDLSNTFIHFFDCISVKSPQTLVSEFRSHEKRDVRVFIGQVDEERSRVNFLVMIIYHFQSLLSVPFGQIILNERLLLHFPVPDEGNRGENYARWWGSWFAFFMRVRKPKKVFKTSGLTRPSWQARIFIGNILKRCVDRICMS